MMGRPACGHGVLVKIREGSISRYRCHTGHAFSLKTLLVDVDDAIDDARTAPLCVAIPLKARELATLSAKQLAEKVCPLFVGRRRRTIAWQDPLSPKP
jgi:hypothetical protein